METNMDINLTLRTYSSQQAHRYSEMELFKMIKDRISPSKDTSLNASGSDGSPIKKRKHTASEDDPFNDKSTRKQIDDNIISNTNNGNRISHLPFIRNLNLSKSLISQEDSNSLPMLGESKSRKDIGRTLESVPKVEEGSKFHSSVVEKNDDVNLRDDEMEKDADDEIALEVLEEMSRLEECFPILTENYRLLDKIGEGTFSTVYKAEALNGSVKLGSDVWKSPPLKKRKSKSKKNPIVALKQIYVTSSPNRIHNELNLLYTLSGSSHVAPLLDVLRYQDQVLAVLPYYRHADFRDFYRDLSIKGIKKYLWELFQALNFVHIKGVIHRDLKPTNFLYDPFKGKGVLVDFGLAEKVQINLKGSNSCPCRSTDVINKSKRLTVKAAYPKQDQRPPRRANRAGTRGFRAPEVLFKCTNQDTKIDIWSAGIIGLSLISKKFPLFNSPDDIDAIIELILIFGLEKLQKCAELHGCGLEVNLPNLNSSSGNLISILSQFLRYEFENDSFPDDSVALDTLKLFNEKGDKLVKPSLSNEENYSNYKTEMEDYQDHKNFMEVLHGSFQMDPSKRMSAKEILNLPFFQELNNSPNDEVVL